MRARVSYSVRDCVSVHVRERSRYVLFAISCLAGELSYLYSYALSVRISTFISSVVMGTCLTPEVMGTCLTPRHED